ncbi:MAG: NifB/NifX family molybdenum-iron cluster-binding protein [Pseudomonadota bacterium]
MKIAIPKDGEMINQHFGRSASFVIITLNEDKIIDIHEISASSLAHNHQELANLLLNSNISLVITGGIGQGMYNALQKQGLKVIRGVSGRINDVVNEYLSGKLKDEENCCNHNEHHEG